MESRRRRYPLSSRANYFELTGASADCGLQHPISSNAGTSVLATTRLVRIQRFQRVARVKPAISFIPFATFQSIPSFAPSAPVTCSTAPCRPFRGVLRFNYRRRIWRSGQLIASIALILVMLAIGSRRALVGILHIEAVVLRRNFLVHFDLR